MVPNVDNSFKRFFIFNIILITLWTI